MTYIYVLIDSDKNVVAIYSLESVAQILKPELEKKIGKSIEIKKRTLDPEISTIGVFE